MRKLKARHVPRSRNGINNQVVLVPISAQERREGVARHEFNNLRVHKTKYTITIKGRKKKEVKIKSND